MDHKVFEIYLQNGPRDADIKMLNTLLSNSTTVNEGLELLNYILEHCSVELLNENLTNWLDICLVKHSEHFTHIKLSLIEKLIEASFTNQELAEKISSEYLSKIIDLCLTSKSSLNEIESAFDVLTICMKKFNSSITHKARIKTHILSFLESSADWIVEKAAVAYLYLQQTGNAGTNSNNSMTNFKTTLSQLCCTVHNLFDVFFQNREFEQYTPTSQESSPLEICTYGDVNITARLIKNVLIFLRIFIQKEFPVHKEITPMELLNLIKRCIAVHDCVSEYRGYETTSADYEFCLLQTDIQLKLLSILRMLILLLRSDCLIFSLTISKILLDCLQRTQDCSCFNIDGVYVKAVYTVLTVYINISKCSLNGYFQTEVIKCIMNDIKPRRNEIALNKQSDGKKESSLKHKSNHEIEDEVRCQVALSTLTAMFNNSFLRVEKSLIDSVLSLIMNIFSDIICSRIPNLYKSSESQLKLHELLVACCEQERLFDISLISMILNILQHSSCSKLNKLAQTCQESLNSLEKICQPISRLLINEMNNAESDESLEPVLIDDSDNLNKNGNAHSEENNEMNAESDESLEPVVKRSNVKRTISRPLPNEMNNAESDESSEPVLIDDSDNLNKNGNVHSEENHEMNAESDESLEPVVKRSTRKRTISRPLTNEMNNAESDESLEPVLIVDSDNLNKNGNVHSEENNEMNAESDESFEPVVKRKSNVKRRKSTNSTLQSDQ